MRWSLPAPLVAIRDEHRYMWRLLELLEEQAEQLRTSGAADLACVRSIMDYMAQYPDRYHHPKEDLIFARVVAADPRLTSSTVALQRGHELLSRAAADIDSSLAAYSANKTRSERVRLRGLLLDYVATMRRHVNTEEATIFEPARRLLDASDWRAIDRQIAPILDPVFGDQRSDKYARLFQVYLDRIVPVANGSVPADLFEDVATRVERMAHAAVAVTGIPSRVVEHGRRRAKREWADFKTLCSSGDLNDARAAFARLAGHYASAPAEYYDVIRDLLWGDEAPFALDGTAPATDERNDPSIRPRPRRANESSISWQAVAINLFLRFTLKPVLASVTTGGAKYVGQLLSSTGSLPKDVQLENVDRKDFRAEWVRVAGLRTRRRRTLLFLPGGGFFFPASVRHSELVARLARSVRSRAMVVHYRLAPEHPFPAGLEDAIAAYRYLLESGTAPQDIIVAGDSAGGGLSLSLVLALRQDRLPLPAGVALLCPLADLSFSTPSRHYNRWLDPVLPAKRRMHGFDLYTGATPRDHPLLSPVFGNYQGLPPMFAQVGSREILLDDTLRVARKARAQGVDFEVEVWEGMPHDWQLFPFIPEANQATSRIAKFFERCWSQPQSADVVPAGAVSRRASRTPSRRSKASPM